MTNISPEDLFKIFDQLGLDYVNTHHKALLTVEESKEIQDQFLSTSDGGGHIKNLYLRDHKRRNFLIVAEQDLHIDLKSLANKIGAKRLSFGTAERLKQVLGVYPGAVTPFAMINGVNNDVELFLDESLKDRKLIYIHPLVNTQTTAMSPEDLERFLYSLNCVFKWINIF